MERRGKRRMWTGSCGGLRAELIPPDWSLNATCHNASAYQARQRSESICRLRTGQEVNRRHSSAVCWGIAPTPSVSAPDMIPADVQRPWGGAASELVPVTWKKTRRRGWNFQQPEWKCGGGGKRNLRFYCSCRQDLLQVATTIPTSTSSSSFVGPIRSFLCSCQSSPLFTLKRSQPAAGSPEGAGQQDIADVTADFFFLFEVI